CTLLSYLSPLLPLVLFTRPPTTAISTLSLHDALPICASRRDRFGRCPARTWASRISRNSPQRSANSPRRAAAASSSPRAPTRSRDRKSTRLNSSHVKISYAVFCLKKKKNNNNETNEHR